MHDPILTAIGGEVFDQRIGHDIWAMKYQYKSDGVLIDATVQDTWQRVATGLAEQEHESIRSQIVAAFYDAMSEFKLIPAGRILSGCGTKRRVTLSNTFVMRSIPDSVSGIMDTIKDAALTMKMGGGIGFDFSTIRPRGTMVKGLDCPAAGPIAAMEVCDSVCEMLVYGMGRGAMMATMRCDHPDIESFIEVKSDRTKLRNFNLSVLASDGFLTAVREGAHWNLVWNGSVVRTVAAVELWNKIMAQTYAAAEPGILFIDRINDANPLNYLEYISATNSCAEQPLPPNGTCPLASINLSRLVSKAFTSEARVEVAELRSLAALAVRMLDNCIDVSRYAIDAQQSQAQMQRRIGVGVTGVADAIAMLGVRYGSPKAAFLVESWMKTIQNEAYRASALLAEERGPFPLYIESKHLSQPCILALDSDVREVVVRHGLRNGVLTTIAPTGTISMFASNVSSGIEPIFSTAYIRSITNPDGSKSLEKVLDYAVWRFRDLFGSDVPLHECIVTSSDLVPSDHIRIQAAAQKWVDSGISKTVNCPEDIAFGDFKDVYMSAYNSGCKGCTTYRPNDITGSVLSI